MVAIVGAPAQRKLTEITCSNNQSAFHIGRIHQDIGTHPCLGILIGGIAFSLIFQRMADGSEVLTNSGTDRNLTDLGMHRPHQFHRIVIGLRRCVSFIGHRNRKNADRGNNLLRLMGNDQCQRRIKTARNTDDKRIQTGCLHTRRKAVGLDAKNRFTTLAQLAVITRHKRHYRIAAR